MRPDELFAQIKTALVEELGVTAERVTPSAELTEDLEMDSLDRVEFLAVLEGRLGRRIDTAAIDTVVTVQDVIDVVVEVLASAPVEDEHTRPAANQ